MSTDINLIKEKKMYEVCPYYNDIVDSDDFIYDEFSYDLIDWYRDLVFSCNTSNKEEVCAVKKIDIVMYKYINDFYFRNKVKSYIDIREIDLNSSRKKRRLIYKLLGFFDRYKESEILNICKSRWI